MPQLSSPLSTPAGMPLLNAAHLGKASGLPVHYPTIAALNAAIAAELANPIGWLDRQPITVATEPVGVHRVWSSSAQHARTLMFGGMPITLASDSAAVLSTSGMPSPSTGADGDAAVDAAAGVLYLRTAGVWRRGYSRGVAAASTSVLLPPVAPAVFAGNGRLTVMLRPVPGAVSYTVTASTGQSVVAAAGVPSVTLGGLANGSPVTVTVSASLGGESTPASAPSRAVTPTALAGLGDIGIDPYHYYHPDALGLANGAAVATLPDLSGNGRDAVQAVAGNRPTFATAFANGRGALRGAGGQWLTFPGLQADHGGDFVDISVWALGTASPSDSRYYSNQASTTDTYYMSVDANGTAAQAAPRFRMLLPAQSPVTLADTGAAVSLLSIALTPRTPGRAYLAGAMQAAPAAPGVIPADLRSWQIFGYGGNNKTLNGYLLHFSRWPSSMTQAQRWAVEAYLAGQFGLTVSQS